MILTDVHTHSTFSADGISPLSEMVACAKRKGLRYYGVSEHFDYDYQEQHILVHGKEINYVDARAYFTAARQMQQEENGETFTLLVGGEFGFAKLERCYEKYAQVIETYQPDFIVNSAHTCDGHDCYFPEYCAGKPKALAYGRYLQAVRDSLDAPYHYDIVAHIGYVSRNAPYEDKKFRYSEFADLIDDILTTVVAKGKILEVNSSSRGAGSEFLPDTDILCRYFELGGRKVSFASDAHNTERIAEKRETVVAELKKIGFTHITVPVCGKEVSVAL